MATITRICAHFSTIATRESRLSIPLPGTAAYEFATFAAAVDRGFWEGRLTTLHKLPSSGQNSAEVLELHKRIAELEKNLRLQTNRSIHEK